MRHEINRIFVCFTCKIKLYFTREHKFLCCYSRDNVTRNTIPSGVHSVGEKCFELALEQTNVVYDENKIDHKRCP